MIFVILVKPFKRTENVDEFALDRTNIGLNLAAVEGVSQITDAKEKANRGGHPSHLILRSRGFQWLPLPSSQEPQLPIGGPA